MPPRLKWFLSRSEFAKNVSLLFSGTAVAQALPIFASPILTRLYTPEQFATLALFSAIISVVGVVSTGKYEFAIMLPDDEEDAEDVATLASLITVGVTLLVLVSVIVFHKEIVSFFNNDDFSPWLYVLPLGILMTGLTQVANFTNNRRKKYKAIAASRIFRSVGSTVINIGVGLFNTLGKVMHTFGLVGAMLVGQLIELIFLNRSWLVDRKKRRSLKTVNLKSVANRYAGFPKYDVPSELMVTASIQLPVLLFDRFFERSIVGLYFQAHKVLSIPMSMIGSAIGQVLLKQLSDCRHDRERFSIVVGQTYRNLIMLACIPYIAIVFFGRELFAFVFGEPWVQAGVYASLISPWLLFNFVGAPLTMIFTVLEKQRKMFFWISIMFVVRVLSVFVGITFFKSTYYTILLFSLSGALFYFCLNFYLVHHLSGVNKRDFLKYTFTIPLMVLAAFGLLRLLFDQVIG